MITIGKGTMNHHKKRVCRSFTTKNRFKRMRERQREKKKRNYIEVLSANSLINGLCFNVFRPIIRIVVGCPVAIKPKEQF